MTWQANNCTLANNCFMNGEVEFCRGQLLVMEFVHFFLLNTEAGVRLHLCVRILSEAGWLNEFAYLLWAPFSEIDFSYSHLCSDDRGWFWRTKSLTEITAGIWHTYKYKLICAIQIILLSAVNILSCKFCNFVDLCSCFYYLLPSAYLGLICSYFCSFLRWNFWSSFQIFLCRTLMLKKIFF